VELAARLTNADTNGELETHHLVDRRAPIAWRFEILPSHSEFRRRPVNLLTDKNH
jgi:hypothetical protein